MSDKEWAPTVQLAVERLRACCNASVEVLRGDAKAEETSIMVLLGVNRDDRLQDAPEDSYVVRTVAKQPLTVLASGTNRRSMLYAA